LVTWINDVSISVNSVTLFIDSLTRVVFEVAILALDRHNVAIFVLAHDTHDVFDVETLALVVIQLWHVSVSKQLLAIKLFTAKFID